MMGPLNMPREVYVDRIETPDYFVRASAPSVSKPRPDSPKPEEARFQGSILPRPDTDRVSFSASGQELAAQAWF